MSWSLLPLSGRSRSRHIFRSVCGCSRPRSTTGGSSAAADGGLDVHAGAALPAELHAGGVVVAFRAQDGAAQDVLRDLPLKQPHGLGGGPGCRWRASRREPGSSRSASGRVPGGWCWCALRLALGAPCRGWTQTWGRRQRRAPAGPSGRSSRRSGTSGSSACGRPQKGLAMVGAVQLPDLGRGALDHGSAVTAGATATSALDGHNDAHHVAARVKAHRSSFLWCWHHERVSIPYDVGPESHPSGRPFRNVFSRNKAGLCDHRCCACRSWTPRRSTGARNARRRCRSAG